LPILPPQAIPNLVNRKGEFPTHLVRAGINFSLRPAVRRQLEKEIRAQFRAFLDTGLPLDHVNGHHHMHLHPTVLDLVLKVGREYGMKAMRLPYEPPLPSWRASRRGLLPKLAAWLFFSPWMALFRNRLRHAKVCSNDFVFGMNDSNHMNLDLVLQFLKYLPQGVTEIYFHPAISRCPGTNPPKENDLAQDEFEALTSPVIRQALATCGADRIAFSDL
jgi:hopanoid biosynthesis associated protein HpnK